MFKFVTGTSSRNKETPDNAGLLAGFITASIVATLVSAVVVFKCVRKRLEDGLVCLWSLTDDSTIDSTVESVHIFYTQVIVNAINVFNNIHLLLML